MEIIKMNPIEEKNNKEHYIRDWKEEIATILGQHIYKQNSSMKKIQSMAHCLTDDVMNHDIRYNMCSEEREIDLYEHLIYTTILAIHVSEKIGLKKEEIYDIAFGCLIHDIGLRFNNAPYENCDMDEMSPRQIYELKNHTILGYTSLESEDWIPRNVKSMVLSHHETLDGSGYPLKQKNTEVECRIIQVCDSVDRIISGIEGRKGTTENAINEIYVYKGIKYDPIVVDVVLGIIA